MTCYLQPTEYQTYGLAADVTDDWITAASSLIDSHCRRTSLNPTQYTERLRIVEGSQTARLSHLPLAPVAPATLPFVSIQARYAKAPPRPDAVIPLQEEVAWAFSLPGAWTTVDPATVDFVADTGELIFPLNILGLPYNEVEVTYTAGLATLPNAVKVRLRADREERPGHARPQRQVVEDRHAAAPVLLRLARRRDRPLRCSSPGSP